MPSPSLPKLATNSRRKPRTLIDSLPASNDGRPWLPMTDMPIGDHRNIPVEVLGARGQTAHAYWTGRFWARAPISDSPVSLGFTPKWLRHPPAPAASAIDPLVSFDGWYRARTETARTAAGWTPESTLYADYLKFAAAVAPDDPALDEQGFRAAMEGTHATVGKRMVRLFDSSREELKDCWSRALMRAIRVAA